MRLIRSFVSSISIMNILNFNAAIRLTAQSKPRQINEKKTNINFPSKTDYCGICFSPLFLLFQLPQKGGGNSRMKRACKRGEGIGFCAVELGTFLVELQTT
jgi:hypothetical protein